MPFATAAQPDIIRAHQKDEDYVRVRRNLFSPNLGGVPSSTRRGLVNGKPLSLVASRISSPLPPRRRFIPTSRPHTH
jgi:hypothetical protein